MEQAVTDLIRRHETLFSRGLAGEAAAAAADAALFAAEFIGASPAGVRAGRNDEAFRQAVETGFDHYRDTGLKEMSIRRIAVTPIDGVHSMARVSWRGVYARAGKDDAVIDFDVHYFVQVLDGNPRIFAWVTGDEQQALRDAGVS